MYENRENANSYQAFSDLVFNRTLHVFDIIYQIQKRHRKWIVYLQRSSQYKFCKGRKLRDSNTCYSQRGTVKQFQKFAEDNYQSTEEYISGSEEVKPQRDPY